MTDGRTDGQTDRQTENTICRAAWSQLKILCDYVYIIISISRQVPDKSAAIKIKQDGKTEVMSRHNMSCFLSEAYEQFKQSHPATKIGFSVFKRLRPQNVTRISETSRKTCLCQTCSNPCLNKANLRDLKAATGL